LEPPVKGAILAAITLAAITESASAHPPPMPALFTHPVRSTLLQSPAFMHTAWANSPRPRHTSGRDRIRHAVRAPVAESGLSERAFALRVRKQRGSETFRPIFRVGIVANLHDLNIGRERWRRAEPSRCDRVACFSPAR
jgi:hypothetical protein